MVRDHKVVGSNPVASTKKREQLSLLSFLIDRILFYIGIYETEAEIVIIMNIIQQAIAPVHTLPVIL